MRSEREMKPGSGKNTPIDSVAGKGLLIQLHLTTFDPRVKILGRSVQGFSFKID